MSTRRWPGRWAVVAPLAAALLAACAAATASMTPFQAAAADPQIPVRHVERDAMGAALGLGNGDCTNGSDVLRKSPDLAALDVQIDLRGAPGRYEIGGVPLAFGTLEQAAELLGGRELVIDPNDAWVVVRPNLASEITSLDTPKGREVWWLGDTAEKVPC